MKARDKVVAECRAAQSGAEMQVSKLWKREDLKAAPMPEEVDEDIEWLTPKKKARAEAALDYAKHLCEVVYDRLQSVSKAATFLPHQLKDGTFQAIDYAQEVYRTVKTVCSLFLLVSSLSLLLFKKSKSASELSSTAVNRISEILKTQIHYCQQLGTYLTDALNAKVNFVLNVEAFLDYVLIFSVKIVSLLKSGSKYRR